MYIVIGTLFGMMAYAAMLIFGVSDSSDPHETEGKEPFKVLSVQDVKIQRGYVTVFHDEVRSVTCWAISPDDSGGVSCIPDSQLKQAK